VNKNMNVANVSDVLKKIREKILQRHFSRDEKLSKKEEAYFALPPFESRIAILSAQRAKWKGIALVASGALLVSLLGSAFLLNNRLLQRAEADILVVPGAPEFMKVRPNLIPDAAVFAFAEYVSFYAGTFSYRNARDHFETLAERMVPALKGAYLRDSKARLSDWQKRKVDQVFAPEPISSFELVNDKFGPKYVVLVSGVRSQYADGVLLRTTDENLLFELRPRLTLDPGSRGDESLFKIERLEWMSRDQAETYIATIKKQGNAK
jgi:hypothetical protein